MPETVTPASAASGADAGRADWIVVGTASSLHRLEPLATAHTALGRRVHRIAAEGEASIRQALAEAGTLLAPEGIGILVAEPMDVPPIRAGWPRPLAPCLGAPVGFLRLDPPALAAYAERAVALLDRPAGGATPFALLGPREPRYLTQLEALAERMRKSAPVDGNRFIPLQWTAERLRKRELLAALRAGAGCALYAGHGNRGGWLAYGGLSLADLHDERPWRADESTAFLASLACGSGAPGGLADAAVGQGLAGAVLAPMDDPLHGDNRRLAEALVQALVEGRSTLGSLMRGLVAQPSLPLAGYVLVGDPGLAPRSSAQGLVDCARVVALSPDAMVAAAPVMPA